MTLVRGKPSGFGVNDKLTSVIMEIIDAQLPYAIDGNAGGTYTPSAPIVIAGTHGLSCTGPFAASGATTLTGTVNCNANTINVNGGNLNMVATTLGVDATSAIVIAAGGVLTCNGPATFNGTVTHNESFSLNSAKTFSCAGTLALGGTGALTGTAGSTVNLTGTAVTLGAGTTVASQAVIVNSGAGRSLKRVVTGGNFNNLSFSAANYDVVYVPAITGNYTWKLTSTGALQGDEMVFSSYDNTSFALTVADDSLITLATLKNISGAAVSGRFIFDSGAWRVTEISYVP